jgi:hypothetical protein
MTDEQEFIEAAQNNEYTHYEMEMGVTLVTNYANEPWVALEPEGNELSEEEIEAVLDNYAGFLNYDGIEIVEHDRLRSADIINPEITT